MQDLVGVCIADPAEKTRIGEGALERVVLLREALAKGIEARMFELETAHVERRERRTAFDQMERCTLARASFREREHAAREGEGREEDPRRRLGIALEPAEPPGDHQVEYEKTLVLEREHDALAEP